MHTWVWELDEGRARELALSTGKRKRARERGTERQKESSVADTEGTEQSARVKEKETLVVNMKLATYGNCQRETQREREQPKQQHMCSGFSGCVSQSEISCDLGECAARRLPPGGSRNRALSSSKQTIHIQQVRRELQLH